MTTDGPVSAQAPPSSGSGAAATLRVQILATEHWSLLATRGTTWSEVMSRISIHLTVASASLVVLALVVQASGYGTAFRVLSIGLASAVLVLGTLTGVRVINASQDDYALLIGMNRLRAAYVELDPTVADYLVTAWHDDKAGVLQTYMMGQPRSVASHVLGSTSMFMNMVNAIVAGTLGALVASAVGAGSVGVTVSGALVGLGYLVVMMEVGRRSFRRPRIEPRFPAQ
jgi:hypothetical protein